MEDKVIVNLLINNERRYECLFSNKLSLKDNIKLINEVLKIDLDNILIVTYDNNCLLDMNIILEDFEFIDGQILYIY